MIDLLEPGAVSHRGQEQGIFTDSLMETCVTTQNVEARLCATCGDEFTPSKFHPKQRYCSRECQNNAARDMQNELLKELKMVAKQVVYRHLHRDCYFSFDGRYEGPLNKSVTFVEVLKKDKGYHPMPVDVHVEGPAPKFTQVTPEDVEWGQRQGRPAQTMPRQYRSFCATCIDVVIDKANNKVRVTKGVYLPIGHECNSVRVYNLQGQLIEVKGCP